MDGTIVDGEKITGALVIAAKNVTIRNSWIISNFSSKGTGRALSGTGVISIEPGASATIDHCTLDGSNATHAGIWHSGHSDPPPLKWSDLRYVFDIKEDCNGKEAIQA